MASHSLSPLFKERLARFSLPYDRRLRLGQICFTETAPNNAVVPPELALRCDSIPEAIVAIRTAIVGLTTPPRLAAFERKSTPAIMTTSKRPLRNPATAGDTFIVTNVS